jgi:hypothetical protein
LRLRPGFFAWPEGFDFCAITARYALGPVGARSLHREAARRTTVPNPRQAGARCRRFGCSSTAGLGAQVSGDLAPRGAFDRYLAERGAGRLQASFGPGRPSGRCGRWSVRRLTSADASTGAVVGLEPASFWFGDLCGRRRRGGTPIAADSVQPPCRRQCCRRGLRERGSVRRIARTRDRRRRVTVCDARAAGLFLLVVGRRTD